LQAILGGYEKSSFYHQKLITDPRPTWRVIEATPDTPKFDMLKRDMNELIKEGLVSVEHIKRKLKWRAKYSKRNGKVPAREFVTVYSITEKGREFVNYMKQLSTASSK
jgi:hypothetical protein